jgi:hypothetical protein
MIDERLRIALDPAGEPPTPGVDMSPEAITGRIREACELSDLCFALGQARAAEPSR